MSPCLSIGQNQWRWSKAKVHCEIRSTESHECWSTLLVRFQVAISVANSSNMSISSDGVAVYYHQQAFDSGHAKRTISRPIRDCPPNHAFLFSRCSRFHSIQQWSLVCRPREGVPHGNGLHWGECVQGEICMEGRLVENHAGMGYHASTAWCVSTENFIPLAKLLGKGKSSGASIETGFHPATGKEYSVAAVLAAPDARTPLKAQSMEIQAQKAEMKDNRQLWRTLNTGDNQCTNCASVEILSVPDETQRILTHIEVKSGTTNGMLFLASVRVQGSVGWACAVKVSFSASAKLMGVQTGWDRVTLTDLSWWHRSINRDLTNCRTEFRHNEKR